MVKMASRIKQQKPGKIRGGISNAENFIKAAQEATDKKKQVMADMQAILQYSSKERTPQVKGEQMILDLRDTSLVHRSTEAETASKEQNIESKSTNEEGEASLHPVQDMLKTWCNPYFQL